MSTHFDPFTDVPIAEGISVTSAAFSIEGGSPATPATNITTGKADCASTRTAPAAAIDATFFASSDSTPKRLKNNTNNTNKDEAAASHQTEDSDKSLEDIESSVAEEECEEEVEDLDLEEEEEEEVEEEAVDALDGTAFVTSQDVFANTTTANNSAAGGERGGYLTIIGGDSSSPIHGGDSDTNNNNNNVWRQHRWGRAGDEFTDSSSAAASPLRSNTISNVVSVAPSPNAKKGASLGEGEEDDSMLVTNQSLVMAPIENEGWDPSSPRSSAPKRGGEGRSGETEQAAPTQLAPPTAATTCPNASQPIGNNNATAGTKKNEGANATVDQKKNAGDGEKTGGFFGSFFSKKSTPSASPDASSPSSPKAVETKKNETQKEVSPPPTSTTSTAAEKGASAQQSPLNGSPNVSFTAKKEETPKNNNNSLKSANTTASLATTTPKPQPQPQTSSTATTATPSAAVASPFIPEDDGLVEGMVMPSFLIASMRRFRTEGYGAGIADAAHIVTDPLSSAAVGSVNIGSVNAQFTSIGSCGDGKEERADVGVAVGMARKRVVLADLPPIHNLNKLIPCQQINAVSEVAAKDIPPPLKKNAVIPTTLPSEVLMPIQLRCDFCQKFDSICSNCNRKWKGILESRKAVLMNNIKPMQHVRKMGIYFGTILYGSQDFLSALLASQPLLKQWCARLGPAAVPKGQPAEIQLKVADEKGRLFGLHVAFAFGKINAAKTLLESGCVFRRCDSKVYPSAFLPTPIPDDWDDMLQQQSQYVEFSMAERARKLRREGDFASALMEYRALLSLNPNSEHAHCGIAKMLFDEGKYEECISQCAYILSVEKEAAKTPAPSPSPKEKEKELHKEKERERASVPSPAALTSGSPSKTEGNGSEGKANANKVDSATTPPSSGEGGAAGTTCTNSSSSGTISTDTMHREDDDSSKGRASAEGGAGAYSHRPPSPPPPAQPPLLETSADVEVIGGIHWAEFGLQTILELHRHAIGKFHERCHTETAGPALKRCGCVVTDKVTVRVRHIPFKLIKENILPFCDCSMLWGLWRAVHAPLVRALAERCGAALCDASIGEMLSQEAGYPTMYQQIAADKPDGDPQHKGALVLNPLRFVGLQVKAMADFNTFVIKSAVAGMNPCYKEPDTSVFFPKARRPIEKLRRVVAVKEFFVHRKVVGGEWRISSAGEWEVDEPASVVLQNDIQKKLEETKSREMGVSART